MRVQAILWTAVAAFYGIIGLIYLALSREPAGSVILLVGCAFGGLVAGWLWHWQKHHETPSADLVDADAGDELGVVGAYTTDSIRPLALAAAFVGIWVGLVTGIWLTGVGLTLMASQIALIVRDEDR